MNWKLQAQALLQVTRGARTLSINIMCAGDFEWIGFAVEGAAEPIRVPGDTEAKLRSVLDDHAHEVLAPQRTLAAAMTEAENYARWWKRSRASHAACDCGPVETEKEGPQCTVG